MSTDKAALFTMVIWLKESRLVKVKHLEKICGHGARSLTHQEGPLIGRPDIHRYACPCLQAALLCGLQWASWLHSFAMVEGLALPTCFKCVVGAAFDRLLRWIVAKISLRLPTHLAIRMGVCLTLFSPALRFPAHMI